MKKIINWLYEKYLGWKLHFLFPNGISEEVFEEAKRILSRKTKK